MIAKCSMPDKVAQRRLCDLEGDTNQLLGRMFAYRKKSTSPWRFYMRPSPPSGHAGVLTWVVQTYDLTGDTPYYSVDEYVGDLAALCGAYPKEVPGGHQ